MNPVSIRKKAVRTITLVSFVVLVALAGFVTVAQEHASVRMEEADQVSAGGPIAFIVKLDVPLPEGAYFQMRISPVSADQEIPLASGEPMDASRTTFRVSGTLPKAAVPGKWHVSVIYLFLAGTSWTNNTIQPNNLTFTVKGQAFPIPKVAEVSLAKQ